MKALIFFLQCMYNGFFIVEHIYPMLKNRQEYNNSRNTYNIKRHSNSQLYNCLFATSTTSSFMTFTFTKLGSIDTDYSSTTVRKATIISIDFQTFQKLITMIFPVASQTVVQPQTPAMLTKKKTRERQSSEMDLSTIFQKERRECLFMKKEKKNTLIFYLIMFASLYIIRKKKGND